MKLIPVPHNPFDNPAKRVARAEGGLMRTAPFPEKPEGYEFYSDDLPNEGSTTGVEAVQNDIPAQEGVSPGVTAGVGQMIKGVGNWIATPRNLMSGVEPVQPEVPGQWSEEDQYRQQLADAAQSQKEIAFGGDTALNLFGTSAPFVPKGSVGIAGGRPPPAVAEAPQIAQPFYSAVEQAVSNIPQGKATGEQWLSTLRNRPGVKSEELEWTGLDQWLGEQKGPVTKQQVLDHIAENKIEVQEVMKGGGDFSSVADFEAAGRPEPAVGGPTKFSQWQLPGGEPNSYREMLLTLPSQRSAGSIKGTVGRLRAKYGDNFSDHWTDTEKAEYMHGNTPAAEFKSSHWDEPNVLAHIRFNDRVIDGKKTLFIEEVQSDFGEATRSAKAHIAEAVDRDFDNIADKMVKDGLITKVCY